MIMAGRKRGLFGGGFGASMPQDMTVEEQAQMGMGGAQTGAKPGLGTRLLGRGWEGKAAALGSAIMGNPFAVQQYQQGQDVLRQRGEQMAAMQRQQAMQMSAAQGMGITPEQAALLGEEGLRSYTLGKLKPEEGPKPGSFEWFQTASEADRALYDQYNPFVVTTGQGPVAVPRRPAIGAKVSMADIGGAPSPTIQNTPAPQLNAQGNPTLLTRAQYQAIVAEMGQAATDNYIRRNNIRVTN